MTETILAGHYQLLRPLSRGGFGQTFLARDLHLPDVEHCCVVKQLQPRFNDSETLEIAKRLFDREAQILHRLGGHDQIPRLLAHFEQDGEFYLVQELIEGQPLSEELIAGQPWPEAAVFALLQDILTVLDFVHSQNVIHRDVKPANLIRRNRDGKIVLIDFGAVKAIRSQHIVASPETSVTIAVGSPLYMPSEQRAGEPQFGSDIYAVGIIGVQALTGQPLTHLPHNPSIQDYCQALSLTVSPALAQILERMLQYDYHQRYPNATQALAAIHEVLSGDTIISSPASFPRTATVHPPRILQLFRSTAPTEQTTDLLDLPDQDTLPSPLPRDPRTPVPLASAMTQLQLSPDPAPSPRLFAPAPPTAQQLWLDQVLAWQRAFVSRYPQVKPEHLSALLQRLAQDRRLQVVGGAIALTTTMVVTHAWLQHLAEQADRQKLAQLEALYAPGQYQDCLTQTVAVKPKFRFFSQVQDLLQQCRLVEAESLAGAERWQEAIALIQQIPQGAINYQTAQLTLTGWLQQLLDRATQAYDAGRKDEAIALLTLIPDHLSQGNQARFLAQQWETEWQTNQRLLHEARLAFGQQDWQTVITKAEQVQSPHPFKLQAEDLIQQATTNLFLVQSGIPIGTWVSPPDPRPTAQPGTANARSPARSKSPTRPKTPAAAPRR